MYRSPCIDARRKSVRSREPRGLYASRPEAVITRPLGRVYFFKTRLMTAVQVDRIDPKANCGRKYLSRIGP
jgi:hypothetical protein